jgi:hypothetical protein
MDGPFADSDDGRQPRLVPQYACGTMTVGDESQSLGQWGGAPAGQANGAWRHGLHTQESRRRLNNLVREAKMRIHQLGKAAM